MIPISSSLDVMKRELYGSSATLVAAGPVVPVVVVDDDDDDDDDDAALEELVGPLAAADAALVVDNVSSIVSIS